MAAHQKGAVDKTKEPKAEAKKVTAPELDATKTYTIVGTGTSKHLLKGNEYPISGADAKAIIEAGHATLKEK